MKYLDLKIILWKYLIYLFDKNIIEFKNIIEILSLIEDRKRFVRLIVADNNKSILEDFCNNFGLLYDYADHYLINKVSNSTMDKFQIKRKIQDIKNKKKFDIPIYISKSKNIIKKIREIDGFDKSSLHKETYYNYPNCCIKNYNKSSNQKKLNWIKNLLDTKKSFIKYDFYANRFSSLVNPYLCCHFDFFPCNLSCKAYNAQCKKNISTLNSYADSNFKKLIVQHLKAALIEYKNHIWYINFSNYGQLIKFKKKIEPIFLLQKEKKEFYIKKIKITEEYVQLNLSGMLLNTNNDKYLKVILFK